MADGDVIKIAGGHQVIGGQNVLTVTRHLTSAEILTLNSAPVTLVAGIAGKAFWPIGWQSSAPNLPPRPLMP